MSVSVESFVTHRINLKIPEVVLRDSIAHLLLSHLREELKGADLEVLLDAGNNLTEVRRQLNALAARMILPLVPDEEVDRFGRQAEIPFTFLSSADL